MAKLFKLLLVILVVTGLVGAGYFWMQGREADDQGFKLVEVTPGIRRQFGRLDPTHYLLTFLKARVENDDGTSYWVKPSYAYKQIKTPDQARMAIEQVRAKNRNKGSQVVPSQCHKVTDFSITSETMEKVKTAENR